jgi:hypothetical protein
VHEGVEAPSLAGAVVVHDHDLLGACGLRAPDGRIDLLRVELPALLVHLVAAERLFGAHNAGDALHVADDLDFHSASCVILVVETARNGQTVGGLAPR